jgi:alkanesulfonate monooxygenase SsuD/methylene tetrahydromethanopterin reductase-like flavin-dependent oxidoreductase (luciferase family)
VRVGVGLPTTVPGVNGPALLEWARAADAAPFTSVGVLERVAYGSFDPFDSLAAAAVVTERVALVTMVAIGPLRSAAVLAKQAASVDELSGGRLVLGLSIGARRDDYAATGADRSRRGQVLSDQLMAVRDAWDDRRVTPGRKDAHQPTLLVGGLSGTSFARMAKLGDGYVHGGGPPRAFASASSKVRAAWRDAERPGRPELWGQGYFALGPEAEEPGAAYLRHYYAFTGPFAERIAAANLTSPGAARDFVRGYEDAGCDELVLLPTVAGLDQLERLADVLG